MPKILEMIQLGIMIDVFAPFLQLFWILLLNITVDTCVM